MTARPGSSRRRFARGPLGRLRRFGQGETGEQLGGFLYGTIVVLAVIVAGAKSYRDAPGKMLAVVFITTGTFWLAHVYAQGLARSVTHNVRPSFAELWDVARHEWAIVKAAGPPMVPVALAVLGVLSAPTSYWLAMGTGLAVLTIDGLLFARALRLGPMATVGVTAANLALGVLLVGMKLLVTH